jgi:hypothetical protein
MEKLIATFTNYSILESDAEHLYELAEFVVTENYRHHTGVCSQKTLRPEILKVYREELRYSPRSKIFVARDPEKRIIGAIRIMQWDRKMKLPMHKLFGEVPLQKVLPGDEHHSVWHIGRFAVTQSVGHPRLSLFKQLIVCAVFPVMALSEGNIIAECDGKLYRILSALHIRINSPGVSVHYMGSETVPVNITRPGIEQFFYREYSFLTGKSLCDAERTLSDTWGFPMINTCA